MIEIRLKPCCYECDCPDVEVDSRELGFVFDDSKTTNSIIYCTHEKVCKKYIESEEE